MLLLDLAVEEICDWEMRLLGVEAVIRSVAVTRERWERRRDPRGLQVVVLVVVLIQEGWER